MVEDSKVDQAEDPTHQRKLVTLLYMDVVGSTAMIQHLDPKDNHEIMENDLLRLVEPIQEHGGRITCYTGDGFKAVFGVPISWEDDLEQAICVGLETLEVSKDSPQKNHISLIQSINIVADTYIYQQAFHGCKQ